MENDNLLTGTNDMGEFLTVKTNPNHFKMDYSKVKSLDDVIEILKAMDLTVSWYTEETPEQFREIQDRGFLTKDGINN